MRYIEQWCDTAVSYIRFKPDRPPVRQELLEHMQDKYDDYVGRGMEPSEAERQTIREMGSEYETGKLLNKTHKPYLGWVWQATRWLVGLMVVLVIWNGIQWALDLHIRDVESVFLQHQYDVYTDTAYQSEDGRIRNERILYLEPNCSACSDGYTFTVTKAAYWEGMYENEETNGFYFLLEVSNPRPWMGYTDTPRWFSAVDSLGNCYYNMYESDRTTGTAPAVVGNGMRTGLFTWTFDMWVENYCSQEAEWLELRYDRDGRDLRLRIDLTGGEGA